MYELINVGLGTEECDVLNIHGLAGSSSDVNEVETHVLQSLGLGIVCIGSNLVGQVNNSLVPLAITDVIELGDNVNTGNAQGYDVAVVAHVSSTLQALGGGAVLNDHVISYGYRGILGNRDDAVVGVGTGYVQGDVTCVKVICAVTINSAVYGVQAVAVDQVSGSATLSGYNQSPCKASQSENNRQAKCKNFLHGKISFCFFMYQRIRLPGPYPPTVHILYTKTAILSTVFI